MRKLIVYILLFLSTIGCSRPFDEQGVAPTPDSVDYEPLVALYQSLGGEGWKNNTNWCSSRPLSEWYGVYTYQERVYAINLFDNNLVGTLPEELSALTSLKVLNLAMNNITGSIPDSFGELVNLEQLLLYNNKMSGEIPSSLNNTSGWSYNWGYAIIGNRYNRFNLYRCGIKAPKLELSLLSGSTLSLDEHFYSRNNYTILFQWSADYADFIPTIQALYDKYRGYGLQVVSWVAEDGKSVLMVDKYGIEWPVAQVSEQSPLSSHNERYYPVGLYPTVTMFNSAGELVFSDTVESRGNIVAVANELFDQIINPELYNSTDFSADGTVECLQSASVGEGVNIVLIGDGFSDRMVADGRYRERMEMTADALFSEAPLAHFRDYFNIYAVTAVSANERFAANTTTALKCQFGEGTLISGDNYRCFDYALKAVPSKAIDDTLIVVVVNSERYAGTTYMYHPILGDYGAGAAIAYIPIADSYQTFRGLICHEAVGHGFAKLDDEYTLEGMGAITAEAKDSRKRREAYGWLKNTDIYHHPKMVKWAHLLALPRYVAEGLGAFEGASTYATGVYRPTEQSIMNKNVGGFNAPSREAIFQRIHRLAYGSGWVYNFEEFNNYDVTNLMNPATDHLQLNSDNQMLISTHEPVVYPYSWSNNRIK